VILFVENLQRQKIATSSPFTFLFVTPLTSIQRGIYAFGAGLHGSLSVSLLLSVSMSYT